jgi:hypothetical protein
MPSSGTLRRAGFGPGPRRVATYFVLVAKDRALHTAVFGVPHGKAVAVEAHPYAHHRFLPRGRASRGEMGVPGTLAVHVEGDVDLEGGGLLAGRHDRCVGHGVPEEALSRLRPRQR